MKHLSLFLAICCWLAACSGLPPRSISRFDMQTPRSFGYLIGDEIQHRLVLETRTDLSLNPQSLPAAGEVNRWLNLKRVTLSHSDDGREMHIDLTYQVFYAPLEVKVLSIPGFTLQFKQGAKTLEQAVPEWRFSLSPLQVLAARQQDAGAQNLKADSLPKRLSTQTRWLGVSLSLAAAGFTALYLAYLYGYLPIFTRQRIFKRACKQLAGLSPNEMGRGLAVLHHALNTLHGQALFPQQLAAFYQAHPEYSLARREIDWFFNFSNQVLFVGRQTYGAKEWQTLHELCRLCRAIERGSR